MLELSESNAVEYLRQSGRASNGEVLVQALSGGVANVVLKVFDTAGGERVGSDLRSAAQRESGEPDARPTEGDCFVLKQPLEKFRTEAEWRVDVARMLVERDCMELLGELLPAGSVPAVRWFDEANKVLAMSCAPPDAVIWKKTLLAGQASMDAATHAGMLLAMMHSSTHGDATVEKRYSEPLFFTQQRIDPYLRAVGEKHPDLQPRLEGLADILLKSRQCLIHGDYSPKNIFLVPHRGALEEELKPGGKRGESFALSHLMLLDFEVAFYGHPVFDVATLVNHLLLKGFYHRRKWRPFMAMADTFWQTYRTTAAPALAQSVSTIGGEMLAALLLARVDGKSPVEYLRGDETVPDQIRRGARDILSDGIGSLDEGMDRISAYFDEPE